MTTLPALQGPSWHATIPLAVAVLLALVSTFFLVTDFRGTGRPFYRWQRQDWHAFGSGAGTPILVRLRHPGRPSTDGTIAMATSAAHRFRAAACPECDTGTEQLLPTRHLQPAS